MSMSPERGSHFAGTGQIDKVFQNVDHAAMRRKSQ